MLSFEVATSWDGFKWAIRRGERFEHDRAVLSKGELSVLRALNLLADSNKVFADVGSHVGYYTCRMAVKCRHVHAFEPNPETLENLERNIRLNNLGNVTVHPIALGDRDEVKKLYSRSASSTLLEGYPSYDVVEVHVRRMDDVLDAVDIVKIDVEGYELNVLRGMKRILEDCKPSLVIEHHDFRNYRIDTYPTISGMLRDMGYVEIYLAEPHRLYVSRGMIDDRFRSLIADHWINFCIMNIKRGREWYIGLPEKWWWGMSLVDFIHELPSHVLEEPVWIELLIRRM